MSKGYDWHGATLSDVKLAVRHLDEVKRHWAEAISVPVKVSTTNEPRIAVVGHSNGGQGEPPRGSRADPELTTTGSGAWYYLSRYPDEVLGGVPASG